MSSKFSFRHPLCRNKIRTKKKNAIIQSKWLSKLPSLGFPNPIICNLRQQVVRLKLATYILVLILPKYVFLSTLPFEFDLVLGACLTNRAWDKWCSDKHQKRFATCISFYGSDVKPSFLKLKPHEEAWDNLWREKRVGNSKFQRHFSKDVLFKLDPAPLAALPHVSETHYWTNLFSNFSL